jgi:Carbohydrate binding domain
MSRAQLTSTTQQDSGGAVAPFLAGKNKIISGDFSVWQRGTTFTNVGGGNYTADRWVLSADVNPTSHTISQQAFTAGAAPVAGYESAYFLRSAITTVGSTTALEMQQRIEDVRTFAGQTVTLSFWAKADSARSSIIYLYQNFGSGGSSGVYVATPTINYTTSWQRFTFTMNVPSISGKTLGTNHSLYVAIRQAAASGSTLDLWGVQLEAGSVATPFTTASNTLQGELALCQRYYWRQTADANNAYANFALGYASGSSNAICTIPLPVTMRTTPTSIDYSSIIFWNYAFSSFAISSVIFTGNRNSASQLLVTFISSGLTTGQAGIVSSNNSTTGYLGFSAEL